MSPTGSGLVAVAGTRAGIRPGDVVSRRRGARSTEHGATPDRFMARVAVQEAPMTGPGGDLARPRAPTRIRRLTGVATSTPHPHPPEREEDPVNVNAYAASPPASPSRPRSSSVVTSDPRRPHPDPVRQASATPTSTPSAAMGPPALPVVPGHEIVGGVARGRRRRHRSAGRRQGRRRLHGRLVRRVHRLPQATSGTAPNGMVPTYAGTDRDGSDTTAATPPASSSTRTSS